MSDILGIDTSNYTTSAALLCGGRAVQSRKLLPVAEGGRGLRQSDAVFHHAQQLPEVLRGLPFGNEPVCAVGVSSRPRSAEGSYMPCFLVGEAAAQAAALSAGAPLFCFSHQQGHIAAALFSADRLPLLREPFLAFHVSGGTTEAVLCRPDEAEIFSTEIAAQSLDLKAGQAVDRVGVMLGLRFPAGPELEKLAAASTRKFRVRPSMKGADCSLSGVENQCRAMLAQGTAKEDISAFCLASILAALCGMAEELRREYGSLPFLFAGGVMSDAILREGLRERYGGVFAQPGYSSDNAVGPAVLAAIRKGVIAP